jgi:hypothetical protein
MGRRGHKNELITNDACKKKDSRVTERGGKSLQSTNVLQDVSNVDANVDIFKIPMVLKGTHVPQVLIVHELKVATIMAQLNEMNNEKAKLLTSIKL